MPAQTQTPYRFQIPPNGNVPIASDVTLNDDANPNIENITDSNEAAADHSDCKEITGNITLPDEGVGIQPDAGNNASVKNTPQLNITGPKTNGSNLHISGPKLNGKVPKLNHPDLEEVGDS